MNTFVKRDQETFTALQYSTYNRAAFVALLGDDRFDIDTMTFHVGNGFHDGSVIINGTFTVKEGQWFLPASCVVFSAEEFRELYRELD